MGGDGDDLLIGNRTVYDTDQNALNAIRAEWKRSDQTYTQRVNHLLSGGGLNGTTLLNTSKVIADGAVDRMTGDAGTDWFFSGSGDIITDLAAGERLN